MALILEVDDDHVQRTVIKRTLTAGNHTVVAVDNGETALGHLKKIRPLPDLVLTDVMMPGMDGWDLVRQMRAFPDTALIPVVFFTALDNPADRLRGYNLAADDYIGKTTSMGELAARVDKCLKRSQELRSHTTRVFRSPIKLTGKLDEVGLAGLLATSALEKATGELILGGPRTARLVLKDGQVHSARFTGAPGPVDAECIYACLTWSSGSFQFSARAISAPNSVGLSTEMLLLEAARRAKAGAAAKPGG